MYKDRIFLSPPYLGGKEIDFVNDAFEKNWIAPMGHNVDMFELEQCKLAEVGYGVALSSGTAAIHLALKWFGVGQDDLVFCSDFTFLGSCNGISYLGAIPVFIDSEPDSWNMSPIALQKAFDWAEKINKMPKAVIIVDLYGESADYGSLLPICEKYNVPVIEDAAEAVGATYKNKKCGSLGNIGIFSYNGNKIVTTSGGGMAVSNDKNAIDKIRFWSTQSRENYVYYEHNEIGYNYRLSNICAGIGRGQLKILDEKIAKRKKTNDYYRQNLKDMPINIKNITEYGRANYWLTVATFDKDFDIKPMQLVNALAYEQIEARPLWNPMHRQPLFKDNMFFSHIEGKSVSGDLYERGVCLPSGEALSEQELEYICKVVKDICSH
jgi:pyridoxal phosphate-dependent aminotransferase EpsN